MILWWRRHISSAESPQRPRLAALAVLCVSRKRLAMATQEAHQPRATGNNAADVREVGSQVVVGPHGGERTISERIIVDGEAFRVVE